MPDLFGNDPAPLDAFSGNSEFDIGRWFPAHGPEAVRPIVEKVTSSLLGEYGVKKLSAVGYCFGAKYVVEGLAQGGHLDAGFIAHPSAIEADELRAIKGPLSIAAAGKILRISSPPTRNFWKLMFSLPRRIRPRLLRRKAPRV